MLKINNLQVEYKTDEGLVKAVNGIDLEVAKGEIIGIVGETGAGKTTTAKAILRLIAKPAGHIRVGEINFNNKDILRMNDKELRDLRGNKVSMIFQDPMTALNPRVKVIKQIAEVISYHQKVSKKKALQEARKILDKVGIDPNRGGEYPNQFSGGMKQRVVIAIALALNPSLLIADEPTTALDVTIQAQILDLMKHIYSEKEGSLILISHDLGVIAKMCKRVYVMYAGEFVESGTLRDIFKNCQHPYTKGLFDSIPKVDAEEQILVPIEGEIPDPTNLPKGCKFSPRCKYATKECLDGEITKRHMGGEHFVKCLHPLGGNNE